MTFVIGLFCQGTTAYHHLIYNRYAQKVYESKQPLQFWNGVFGAAPCEARTYFHYMEYKSGNEKISKKGDLPLTR